MFMSSQSVDTSYLPKPKTPKKYLLEKSNRVQFSTTIDIHTRELLNELQWMFPRSTNDKLPSGKGVVIDYAVAALNLLINKKQVKFEDIPLPTNDKK